jgi:DNA-binding Lrp family transcriptional regulator
MVEVFVLITCDYGQEERIIDELNKIKEIKILNKVEGPYNILIKIAGEDIDKIRELVTAEIKTIDKIRHTLTLKVKTV